MASLHVQPDPRSFSGGWVVSSDHPAAVAAVPDSIVQLLNLSSDAASIWSLHPSEQTGSRLDAYPHERQELGPMSAFEVVELLRPRQPNVVWVDRYHLVAHAPSATVVSRLLGLYAGSQGRVVAYVHHPSVAGVFRDAVARCPHDDGRDWDVNGIVEQSRFAIQYESQFPAQVRLACATPFRQQTAQALAQLAQTVASW